jgi:8-oxo-dGTP diphosphatase
MKLVLVAAAALVDVDNRVLLARRPEGKSMAGLWEFPGGKVEVAETPEAALRRELAEELSIAYDTFHLLMPLYLCRQWEGEIVPREGQAIAWVRPTRLNDYPMPPADLPLIPWLRDLLA